MRVTLIRRILHFSFANSSSALTFCICFMISFFVKKETREASVQDYEREAATPPFSVLISIVV